MTYSCPRCGWETEELPDAVMIEVDRANQVGRSPETWDEEKLGPRFVQKSKGHSDMSTHICPECEHEGWFQGWAMEMTPEV